MQWCCTVANRNSFVCLHLSTIDYYASDRCYRCIFRFILPMLLFCCKVGAWLVWGPHRSEITRFWISPSCCSQCYADWTPLWLVCSRTAAPASERGPRSERRGIPSGQDRVAPPTCPKRKWGCWKLRPQEGSEHHTEWVSPALSSWLVSIYANGHDGRRAVYIQASRGRMAVHPAGIVC